MSTRGPGQRHTDTDLAANARRWRNHIIRTCDVPRAVDLSLDMFASMGDPRATAADRMFALAMAAAVLAAERPAAEREAAAAALGLLILECLPHATERLSSTQPRWMH